MRSLTNRLRLSWLTVVAFAAFIVVGTIRPDDISVARLLFARDPTQFQQMLLRPRELTIRFETITLLRAQLAADMMFLVAYGLLIRASVRALASVPFARYASYGAIVVMIADAAENIFGLLVLRTFGEDTNARDWWFPAMNIAAATKWVVAGIVLLSLAVGWRREATTWIGWRRYTCWVIGALFGIGGIASAAVVSGLAVPLPDSVANIALFAAAAGWLLQFRLLETSGLMLRFLYVARVPLIVLLLLAAFGPIALGPAVELLGGILVAANLAGVALTTMAAMAVSFACGAQVGNVRAYAWLRVQDGSLQVLDHEVIGSGVFWTGVVAAGSLLFAVGLVSLSLNVVVIGAGVVAGAVAALTLQFGIELLTAYLSFTPSGYARQEALPFRYVPSLSKLLDAAVAASPPALKQKFVDFVGSFAARLFGGKSGYVESVVEPVRGKRYRILPGHTFAAVQFLLAIILFWGLLYGKSLPVAPSFYTESPTDTEAAFLVPTATSIVLLLLLTSWALAALAFFFDRYRTPLFTVVLAAALISGSWLRTDYVVSTVEKPEAYELATPGQVLQAFGERPLVVAAAGGGIQAGAWTTRVLLGLDQHLQGRLRSRLAMISSVSGGSMGSLYYGAYDGDTTLTTAAEQALKPSLDDVATAFVGRDIFGVVGFRRGRDRGAALESSWEQRLPQAETEKATMRTWSRRTRDFALGQDGSRPFPAFLFNSTIVESGQPVAFATTQFPTPHYRSLFPFEARQHPTVENANRILRLASSDDAPVRDVGLKAVTAARLSAAFPYVSPAAALNISAAEPFHLVDGGYYDTYGLAALSQWVDDALEELSAGARGPLPTQIGVVIARGLASSDSALSARLRNGDVSAPLLDSTITRKGWRWQLTAPLSTVLHAQTFAQWAGGIQALHLLKGKWRGRGVDIVPYVFDYPGTERAPVCQGSPLSWKLTSPQQKCIERAWKTFESNRDSALWKLQ